MGNFKKDIGERLAQFIKIRKIKKYELAKMTNVSDTHIKKYLTAEFDPIKLIERLFEAGHISINEKNWLLTGQGEIFSTEEERIALESGFAGAEPTYQYPVLSEVFAGEPNSFVKEHFEEYYSFPYKKNDNRCFVLRVNGESMESTLSSGDLVLCDMDAPLTENCLVAVKLSNGNQYIKRYREVNYAFIQLSSDNPNYDTRLIDKKDIVAIYRVVQSVRQH